MLEQMLQLAVLCQRPAREQPQPLLRQILRDLRDLRGLWGRRGQRRPLGEQRGRRGEHRGSRGQRQGRGRQVGKLVERGGGGVDQLGWECNFDNMWTLCKFPNFPIPYSDNRILSQYVIFTNHLLIQKYYKMLDIVRNCFLWHFCHSVTISDYHCREKHQGKKIWGYLWKIRRFIVSTWASLIQRKSCENFAPKLAH